MSIRLKVVLILFLLLTALRAEAQIAGEWVMEDGSAVLRLEANGEELSARVVALLRPRFSVVDGSGDIGATRRDIHNPDPTLSERPVLGMEIATGLYRDGDVWRGYIYDPGSGKTYRCIITPESENSLRVRGYVGFSMLGRTMYWQRLEHYRSLVLAMLEAVEGNP